MDEDYDIINLHPYDISVQELLGDNGDDARVNISRPDGRRSLSRQSTGANEEPPFKKRKKKAENREDVMEQIFGDLWSRSMEGGLESNNEELENDKEEVSDANVQEGLSDG